MRSRPNTKSAASPANALPKLRGAAGSELESAAPLGVVSAEEVAVADRLEVAAERCSTTAFTSAPIINS